MFAWLPPSSSLAEEERLRSLLVHCSLRSLSLALCCRCLPHSLADEERVRSLDRPGQRRASLAPCGGARFPTLAVLILHCSRIALCLTARFARCDVRLVAAVFVGSDGTEKRCSVISSCRSAARTSRIRRRRRPSQRKERLRSLPRALLAPLAEAGAREPRPSSLPRRQKACLLAPGQRRASLAPCDGARFPTLAARPAFLAERCSLSPAGGLPEALSTDCQLRVPHHFAVLSFSIWHSEGRWIWNWLG
jgi:hypothetical protein